MTKKSVAFWDLVAGALSLQVLVSAASLCTTFLPLGQEWEPVTEKKITWEPVLSVTPHLNNNNNGDNDKLTLERSSSWKFSTCMKVKDRELHL